MRGAISALVLAAMGTVAQAPQAADPMPSAAADWPSFRGPGAAGSTGGPGPPETFSGVDGTNLVWRLPIDGLAHASPIVAGDRVFVTTAVSEAPRPRFGAQLPDTAESVRDTTPHEWRILALDRDSGALLWQRTPASGVPRNGRHRKGSFNNSTPATDGVHVVAFFGDQGLFAYDLEGNALWSVDLGPADAGWFFDPTFQWGSASSPVIWDGKVIVQVDVHSGSFIAAFDIADGRQLWRTPRDEVSSWSSPTVVEGEGGAEIVTNGGRAIRAYDPETGAELWRLQAGSEIAVPTPVFGQGLIIVGAGYLPRQPLFAIRPGGRGDITPGAGGTERAGGAASARRVAWSSPDKGPLISTPIVVGDYVYALSREGILSCFDARTGLLLYAEPIDPDAAATRFSASPIAAGGRLYLASEGGYVYVVRAGALLNVTAKHPVGEAIVATPAIAAGLLLVRGRESLFAFGG